MNSSLEKSVEFTVNPDPRCPCVLLLDTSGSMAGTKIQQLNNGLITFQQDINQDPLASRRCEIAIITFGNGGVQTLQDFVTVDEFEPPYLTAGGGTPMGEAISCGLELLDARKQVYKENTIPYYRPWLFLITDGEPTDSTWQQAADRVQEDVNRKGLAFFVIGVQGANIEKLSRIATKDRPPATLQSDGNDGARFQELFLWLSTSQQRISASQAGDKVMLPSTDPWAYTES